MPQGPAQPTLTIYLINDGIIAPGAIIRGGTERHPVTLRTSGQTERLLNALR